METMKNRNGVLPPGVWLCGVLAVAVVIFYLSFFRPTGLGGFYINDKIGHAIIYASLAFMLSGLWARVKPACPRGNVIVWAIGIATLYGICLEFGQGLFTSDRTCGVLDMLADLAGSGAGAGIWAGGALAAQVGMRMRT